MFKVLLFVLGSVAGATGAGAWLLEGTGKPTRTVDAIAAQSNVLEDLKVTVQRAIDDGKRAGQATEERLRGELNAYRRGETSRV